MIKQTIRERLWLWGMKVNVLQETSEYAKLNFGKSTMTVENAIQETGIRNVIMAGGLPIDRTSLEGMPSSKRIICKWSLHKHEDGKLIMNEEECLSKLMSAKGLATTDRRIEGFHVDDFSTGSIDAGVKSGHLAQLQFANAVYSPQLPLGATVYTMSLERPELISLLPYFAQFLVPLWHADRIDTLSVSLDRLSELSGGKPMMLCLYLYDFGNSKPISGRLMQQHLDTAEKLLLEQRIIGLCICGTCMMDLDWEANHCLYEWLERTGDKVIGNG